MNKYNQCVLTIPYLTEDTRCTLEIFKEEGKPTVLVISDRDDNKGPKAIEGVGQVVVELAKHLGTQPDKIEIFVRESEHSIKQLEFRNGGNSTIQGGTRWLPADPKPIEKDDLDKKLAPATLLPMTTLTLELEENAPTTTWAVTELSEPGASFSQPDWVEVAVEYNPKQAAAYKTEIAMEQGLAERQNTASLTTSEKTEKTAPPITLDDDFGQDLD